MHHLPVLIPVIFDLDLETAIADENFKLTDKKLKDHTINQILVDCVLVIKMSEVRILKF